MYDMQLYTTMMDAAQKHILPSDPFPWQEPMEHAVPFDITQVFEWLAMERSGTPIRELIYTLPTCKPPFTHTYMEYDPNALGPRPMEEADGGGIEPARTGWQAFDRIGVLMFTATRDMFTEPMEFKRDDEDTYTPWAIYGMPISDDVADDDTGPWFTVPENGSVVWARIVLLREDGAAVSTFRDTNGFLALDEQGNPLTQIDANGIKWVAYRLTMGDPVEGETETEAERTATRSAASEAVYTALFACSLLHCVNVGTQDHRHNRALSRHRERKNLPLIGWKSLTVTPHGRWTYQGQTRRYPDGDDSRRHRQHIVRGYFAEYGTNGRGLLFGKHAGRYWIPPHIRGLDGPGVILKDYTVSPATKRNAAYPSRVATKRKGTL